jgi:hypothetical protein
MLNRLRKKQFDVLALHHAEAVMKHDMPSAISDIEAVLSDLTIPIEELVAGGGGEAQSTQRLRRALTQRGWNKEKIEVRKLINDKETHSQSHEIDHVKRFGEFSIALEIEWNNKDPFFDRDLESFKRLHAEGAISVGVIVTRGQSLQTQIRDIIKEFAEKRKVRNFKDLKSFGYNPTTRQQDAISKRAKMPGKSFADTWAEAFVSDKFGEATTHWRKLEDRVKRGVGNPCPLLLIGIPVSVVQR